MKNHYMKCATKVCAALLCMPYVPTTYAAETSCPSADDVPYSTQVGETWFTLGGRAYCLDGPGDRSRAALALYEYNRGRVGPNARDLPEGVTVCLPKYLHGPFFDATRCRSAPVPENLSSLPPSLPIVEPKTPIPTQAICGNGVKEESEWCDGTDLVGNTCTGMNLPAGVLRCRSDCHGFDASGCVREQAPSNVDPPRTPKPVAARDEPQKSMRIGLVVDVGGGMLVPLASNARMVLYGPLGFGRIGTRLTVGFVEVAIHGYVGGNRETTAIQPVEQYRSSSIVGGGLQVGVPLVRGSFRVTPGVEALYVFGKQTRELPEVFKQPADSNPLEMPLFGAYVRAEYRFRRMPRLGASMEIALDYVPQRIESLPGIDNAQMKVLGGLSYVAF